jgi:hypothetical protein
MQDGRRASRHLRRLAVVTAVAVAVGLASGAAPATADRESAQTAAFSCDFPSGARQLAVDLSVRVPTTGTTGRPMQPQDLHLQTKFSPDGLVPARGSAELTISPAIAGVGQPALWKYPNLSVAASADPAAPVYEMTGAGTAPPVVSALPGRLSYVAVRLKITLESADGHKVEIGCASVDPSGVELASTQVADAFGSPTGNAGQRAGQGHSPSAGTGAGAKKTGRSAAVVCPGTGSPALAYMVGYSNVKKLNGASLVGPALVNLCIGTEYVIDPDFTRILITNTGDLDIPPFTSTFLSFGFTPTTATLKLTQVDLTIIMVDASLTDPTDYTVEVTSNFSLRAYDVNVNGTPLDVGPNCRGSGIIHLVLHREGDYTPDLGGTLAGTMTIPSFTGCGVTEDLDPLLTASISGPDNLVRMTQGVACFPEQTPPLNCPPNIPAPRRGDE